MKKLIAVPFAIAVLMLCVVHISMVWANESDGVFFYWYQDVSSIEEYEDYLQNESYNDSAAPEFTLKLKLISPAFKHKGVIPEEYTCNGDNVSPRLKWSNIPQKTKSFALIVDDPDAYGMTWVHWVLYNIPAKRFALPKGVTPEHLPPGTLAGINDFFTTDYQGPCPPTGCHRYFFKIYALDTKLPDLNHPTKAQLESAMQGHILGQAQLVGRYSSDGSCE